MSPMLARRDAPRRFLAAADAAFLAAQAVEGRRTAVLALADGLADRRSSVNSTGSAQAIVASTRRRRPRDQPSNDRPRVSGSRKRQVTTEIAVKIAGYQRPA